MATFDTLALAYRYPTADRLLELRTRAVRLSDQAPRRALRRFLEAVGGLTLAEWEELHTRTLDLAPLVVPYVGHAIWGENYQRGAFMVSLTRAQAEVGVRLDGELPDHLEPILRYLDVAVEPLPELMAVLDSALDHMELALEKAEAGNPYRYLLQATRLAVSQVSVGTGGVR